VHPYDLSIGPRIPKIFAFYEMYAFVSYVVLPFPILFVDQLFSVLFASWQLNLLIVFPLEHSQNILVAPIDFDYLLLLVLVVACFANQLIPSNLPYFSYLPSKSTCSCSSV
jgi:hypothetical protein